MGRPGRLSTGAAVEDVEPADPGSAAGRRISGSGSSPRSRWPRRGSKRSPTSEGARREEIDHRGGHPDDSGRADEDGQVASGAAGAAGAGSAGPRPAHLRPARRWSSRSGRVGRSAERRCPSSPARSVAFPAACARRSGTGAGRPGSRVRPRSGCRGAFGEEPGGACPFAHGPAGAEPRGHGGQGGVPSRREPSPATRTDPLIRRVAGARTGFPVRPRGANIEGLREVVGSGFPADPPANRRRDRHPGITKRRGGSFRFGADRPTRNVGHIVGRRGHRDPQTMLHQKLTAL